MKSLQFSISIIRDDDMHLYIHFPSHSLHVFSSSRCRRPGRKESKGGRKKAHLKSCLHCV